MAVFCCYVTLSVASHLQQSNITVLGREGIGQFLAMKGDMMQKRDTGDEEYSKNRYLEPEVTRRNISKSSPSQPPQIPRNMGRGFGFPTGDSREILLEI